MFGIVRLIGYCKVSTEEKSLDIKVQAIKKLQKINNLHSFYIIID